MQKKDFVSLGYKEVEHAGFSWIANEEGEHFLLGVDDWSAQALPARKGWNVQKKPHHTVYFGCGQDGRRYLIKFYPTGEEGGYFNCRKKNRAKNEFFKTLLAHQNKIPTILPLAVGESMEEWQRGVIIYPFLEHVVTLERVYDGQNLTPLTIREKHCLEKAVGKLMRRFIDVGAYPVDAHLDHFLAMKADGTDILVYYVDLERIKFDFVLKRLLRRRKLVMTLGRLVARLEWFRASGGRINRPSMMRIGHAYFNIGVLGTLDRRLCRVVVKAARKFWYRRGFHVRGRYLLRSFQRYE